MPAIGFTPQSKALDERIVSYVQPVDTRAMHYVNERVVKRIMLYEHVSRQEAEVLFTDMLQFLCLCGAKKDAKLTPPRSIDAAWHHFILFTRDYAEFCQKYFGRFIHHQPFEEGEGCNDSGVCSSSHPEAGETIDQFTTSRPTSIEITVALANANFAPLSHHWTY